MKDKNRAANQVLADMMFFDFLKEKVGERKTKTGAYYDLLEKATAGFIAPFLKNHEYVLQADQCHVTISDLAVEWHWHRATVRAFLDKLEEMGYILQPHTSAGRIPSDAGYRLYVDRMMEEKDREEFTRLKVIKRSKTG